MPVAKSYQTCPIVKEPFELSGKMYCKIRKPSGLIQQVRWYTEKEYNKIYPSDKIISRSKNEKKIFGFDKGYITLVKSDDIEWLKESPTRFSTFFGWYVVSNDKLPSEQPKDIKTLRLDWETVGREDGTLIPRQKIANIVEKLFASNSKSQWIGAIGERLDLVLTVVQIKDSENRYGRVRNHIFADAFNNQYSWRTSAKMWNIGEEKSFRGTVKEHIIVNGEKVTALTRCIERK